MNEKKNPSVKQHFIAGTTAGIASSVILYPIDLIKVRYQVYDKTGNAYTSLSQAFRTIVKEEGLSGLYQGLIPSTIASALSWGGYFYFYENSKKRKLQALSEASGGGPAKLETQDHLLSGIEAGSVMVFITNPFWLLKTRLQIQGPIEAGKPRYNGLNDAVKTILKEEGPLGFYKGIIPALLLTSHGAVQFAAYEWMKNLYQNFMNNYQDIDHQHQQPAYLSMIMGGAAKIVASVVTYPYQVIKSRLQQRDEKLGTPRYRGVIHCTQSILKREGAHGFFKGLIPNCLKVAPNASLTFVVYEECLKLMSYLDNNK